MTAADVELYDPLPEALHHYCQELESVLAPRLSVVRSGSSVERSSGGTAVRAVRQVRDRLRAPAAPSTLVVTWPALGRLDPASWALAARRRRVLVLVHDPEPLRRQRGHGRLARLSERAARWAGVVVVAQSEPAARVLRERGFSPLLLPHPVLPPTQQPARPDGPVLVLGQYKPARSLAVLETLAACPALDGLRVVRGRGWPPVEGWQVDDRFLSEAEFEAALRGARALVLPYDLYFQSNVAVRALEVGVPVVADRHPFLAELWGEDWPGFVVDDRWDEAVVRVAGVPGGQMARLCEAAHDRARHAWQEALLHGRAARA